MQQHYNILYCLIVLFPNAPYNTWYDIEMFLCCNLNWIPVTMCHKMLTQCFVTTYYQNAFNVLLLHLHGVGKCRLASPSRLGVGLVIRFLTLVKVCFSVSHGLALYCHHCWQWFYWGEAATGSQLPLPLAASNRQPPAGSPPLAAPSPLAMQEWGSIF
jgi:hypothetical protein